MTASRVEHIGDATLYLGDCREVLPTLSHVDHVISGPPYSEKTHAGARTGAGDEKLIRFDSIDDDQFIAYSKQFCELAQRWVVMTCDWQHAALIERALPDSFIRCGVWIKPNGMPQYTGDRPATGWEAVAILHRPGRNRSKGGGAQAVRHVPNVHGTHPTEKPLALVQGWISAFTDYGEAILDPFMGSGTTGAACLSLGRRFIGIEIDPKHFDTACRRIEAEHRRPRLPGFDHPKPKQESIFEARYLPHGEAPADDETVSELRGHHAAHAKLAVRTACPPSPRSPATQPRISASCGPTLIRPQVSATAVSPIAIARSSRNAVSEAS